MWHIIFLRDKWAVLVWSKIRSAENDQSCKEAWEKNWDLVSPHLQYLHFSSLDISSLLMMSSHTPTVNIKMCFILVAPALFPVALHSRWWPVIIHDTRTKTGANATKKTKYFKSSCLKISEMTQLSGASLLLWPATHILPNTYTLTRTLHYRSSDAFTARQKGNGCMFFIGDLSVSWLSSHNKSPALSWGWTFGPSGGRRMTCRPLKCSGSSDGSAALTEKYTQQSNQ